MDLNELYAIGARDSVAVQPSVPMWRRAYRGMHRMQLSIGEAVTVWLNNTFMGSGTRGVYGGIGIIILLAMFAIGLCGWLVLAACWLLVTTCGTALVVALGAVRMLSSPLRIGRKR